MYCKKCGNMTLDGSELCEECREAAAAEAAAPVTESAPAAETQQPVAEQGSKKYGLPFGIAGMVLGFLAAVFTGISYGMGLGLYNTMVAKGALPVDKVDSLGGTCNTLAVIGLIGGVAALILGIIAIAMFVKQKKAGKVKPIPTLIFGIVSCTFFLEALSCAMLAFGTASLMLTTFGSGL